MNYYDYAAAIINYYFLLLVAIVRLTRIYLLFS